MGNPIAMIKLNFNDCLWLALKFFKSLGSLGLASLSILLGCSLFYVFMALPLDAQINMAQQQLDNVKPNEMTLSNAQEIPANDMSQDIAAIKKMLPHANTLHDWLGLIDKAAFKQGLRLNRGDYKFTQIKQSKIAGNQKVSDNQYASRYEIVLPVTGQYVQIRQFIANVLQSQPALALSSLKIQRENALAANVEARLVFVLFLQGDSL
jgi:Tfp pilus assembly protein PilO